MSLALADIPHQSAQRPERMRGIQLRAAFKNHF